MVTFLNGISEWGQLASESLGFCVAYMHFKERIYHCMFPSVTPLIIAA